MSLKIQKVVNPSEPQMSSLPQLCALVVTIEKQIVQLDLPPDIVGRTNIILFFIRRKDICEIATNTDQLSISFLQLWLL